MANEPPDAKPVSTADGTLCNLCEYLFGGPCQPWGKNIVSRSFKSVQDSRGFCKVCDLVYRKVPPDSVSIDQQQLEYTLVARSVEPDGMLYIRVTYNLDDTGTDSDGFFFGFISTTYVCNGQFFPGRLDSAEKSGRAQELIDNWIDDCTKKHVDCRNVADGKWHPTRLLDIGEGPGFNSLRLCEGDEIMPGVTYMTLSHCWGGSQPIKLTHKTHPNFRKSIAFTSLPKTFRDALEVVRRLGKRYIWIVPICILQDCVEDWKRESDMMCSVYRNSFCNIGATGASNSTEGCFIEKTDDVLHVFANRKEKHGTGAESAQTEFYHFDVQEWDRIFRTAPLHKRAWVVQERLLAPRMLHFGLSQIAWECNELQATERFPVGWTSASFIFKGLNSSQTRESESQDSFEMQTKLTNSWYKTIELYSEARLTEESDRIAALTGIVDRYKALTSDDFLAGLWRSTFVQDLCWLVDRPGKRHNSYIAPSWSWLSVKDASILGENIGENDLYDQEEVCAIHVEVTPSPSGSKYTIMDGHILCWGKLASAKWSSSVLDDSKTKLLVRLDSNTTRQLSSSAYYADTLEAMDSTELLLFPVRVCCFRKVYLLVLQQNNEDPTTYQRIGMCITEDLHTLWAACNFFTNKLHSDSHSVGLKPVVRDHSPYFLRYFGMDNYRKHGRVRGGCVHH